MICLPSQLLSRRSASAARILNIRRNGLASGLVSLPSVPSPLSVPSLLHHSPRHPRPRCYVRPQLPISPSSTLALSTPFYLSDQVFHASFLRYTLITTSFLPAGDASQTSNMYTNHVHQGHSPTQVQTNNIHSNHMPNGHSNPMPNGSVHHPSPANRTNHHVQKEPITVMAIPSVTVKDDELVVGDSQSSKFYSSYPSFDSPLPPRLPISPVFTFPFIIIILNPNIHHVYLL